MTEITIIHESAIGADDATEYRAVLLFADEIERRRGCINYGAVSRIAMTREAFERYLTDGKTDYTLTERAGSFRFRCEDTRVTLHADASGMLDLSPLGWEFPAADKWLYVEPFRSEYSNGGQF